MSRAARIPTAGGHDEAWPSRSEGPASSGPRIPDAELIARLKRLVADSNLTTVARGIGCHGGTLGKLLGGSMAWTGPLRAKASEYLRLESIRAADAAAGIAGRLVPTSVSRVIADVATVCQVQHAIGEVRGTAAAGKTCGARMYARSNPAAVYVHVSAAVNTPGRMLEELWHAAGFRYHGPPARSRSRAPANGGKSNRARWARRSSRAPTVRRQYEQLVEAWRVGEGETSARVLLIDDAHLLSDSTLTLIQTLHDDCGVAVVLIGTTNLARLQSACGAGQMYEQIVSRVAVRRTIVAPPAADAAAVARAVLPTGRGITPAGRDYLADAAAGFGGLRAVRWLVQLALSLPRSGPAAGEDLDRPHLAAAWRMLGEA